MAVNYLSLILAALTTLHSIHTDNLRQSCLFETFYSYNETICADENGKQIKITRIDNELSVQSHKPMATINLKMFQPVNLTIVRPDVFIKNCAMEKNVSFGDLFLHLGIEKVQTFKGINIGSSSDGPFSNGFEKVKIFKLSESSIGLLKENFFQSMPILRSLNLERNKISELHKNVFISLVQLQHLYLTENELEFLDCDLFQNLSKLITLDLSSNKLTNLTEGLFDNLKILTIITLANNRLENISEHIFRGLQSVTHVNLSYNNLSTIHPNTFANTRRLFVLNLSNNSLTTIHRNAFANTSKLTTLNLSKNKLSFNYMELPLLTHLGELEILDISNNHLTIIPDELLTIYGRVDLRFNQISLKLRYFRVGKNIDLSRKHDFISLGRNNIDIRNNPLYCDDAMDPFLKTTEYRALADAFHKHQRCIYASVPNDDWPHRNCPNQCVCEWIPRSKYFQLSVGDILISCGDLELTTVPEINTKNLRSIVLDLRKNNLKELSELRDNLLITFIQASHNKISKIELQSLPPNLRGLDLSHNNIVSISSDVFKYLEDRISLDLEIIFLKGNPFECYCWFEASSHTEMLIEFAEKYYVNTDLRGEKCDGDYELSKDEHEKSCSRRNTKLSLIVLTVLAVLSGILIVLFYQHQKFIKVWLFAHNTCLWWVDEEYVDRDLEFDAFISYSQKDELYVHDLVNELENGAPKYKIFVHERDFLGGQEIGQGILNAVARSRRTIIILSKDFLQSPWATHEFHCAYRRCIAEKRNRLIVVKHGDIGRIADLDEVIRTYIQTYTYIESNDKWFWERIRYALPHKHSE